jgi:hypothetical protein
MNQSISLTQVLADLHLIGYTEHFYIQEGILYYSGIVIEQVNSWIHCHWHDEVSDDTVRLHCCISQCGKKGVYID